MAITKDFLKTAGLTDEQCEAIFAERGKEITAEKEKFEQSQKNYAEITEQLKKANETIDGFKNMNIDEIKATSEKYKAEAEQVRADHESYVKQQEFDTALNSVLSEAKAKNLKAVKALLDMDKLHESKNLNDDIKSQIETIRTDNDYLFDNATAIPTITAGTDGKPITNDDRSRVREIMGLPPLSEK